MFNKYFFIVALTVIAGSALAQDSSAMDNDSSAEAAEEKSLLEKAPEALQKGAQNVGSFLGQTQGNRENTRFGAILNFSPLDLIIPYKIGATFVWTPSATTSYEVEYLRGSFSASVMDVNIASATDQKLSLLIRSYGQRNSFNVSYGVSYFDLTTKLDKDFVNRSGVTNIPDLDIIEYQSLGLNLGIGNRWIVNNNITFGIDWISWYQPMFSTHKKAPLADHSANATDRDDIKKALDTLSWLPRLSFLKLQVGISF